MWSHIRGHFSRDRLVILRLLLSGDGVADRTAIVSLNSLLWVTYLLKGLRTQLARLVGLRVPSVYLRLNAHKE